MKLIRCCLIAVALCVVAGVGSRAAEITAPAGVAVQAAPSSSSINSEIKTTSRLYAEPVGDTQLQANQYSSITTSFVLNNDGDRIGVSVKLCKDLSDEPCDTLTFVYPQLSLDRVKGLVYWGEVPVATFRRWGSRIAVTKAYRLGTEVVSDRYDIGFNRYHRESLRVFLEHR